MNSNVAKKKKKNGCAKWGLNPRVQNTVGLKSTSLDHSDICASKKFLKFAKTEIFITFFERIMILLLEFVGESITLSLEFVGESITLS